MQLPKVFFPSKMTPTPSNPLTMTQLWNMNVNTPRIDGTRGGQREGAFASVRSLAALGVVQRTPVVVEVGGVKAYASTMLVRGQA